MASAIERHLEANADAQQVEAARRRLEGAGVRHVLYQFVSVGGRVLGKLAPARHLERNLERGVQFHGSAIADLQSDRHGNLIGAGPEAPEFLALPELASLQVLPWDAETARMFCRLYRRRDAAEGAGEPLPTDPRGNLARVHEAFAASTGLRLRSGCEPEMSWLGPEIEPVARPGMSPAYHVGALERVREISRRVIAYGQAMGLDMIEGDYEDAGQLELNFAHDDCLATCDRLTTYRQICMQVARELDVTATFMPKPAVGVMANGCHHNLSLWRGEENVFADPSRRELHLTDTARHALGGLLAHAGATTAVAAPTVNSYARFWDAGQFAPAAANWGFDNRTCTVRVSAIGRLEWKLPDASVNPYLTHAVALAAMRDGLERELDPGPPEQSSGYDDEVAARARFAPLPRTLGDALDALAADEVVAGALTPELLDVFCELKRDEWARFLSAVTEWHRETYLHVVP